jgi:hypothetical protein
MPGKHKTGDPTTRGPDWMDIATTIRAIESTHSATLVLNVKADGALYAGSVSVEVVATLPVMVGPGQPLRLSMYSVWPSRRAKTLEGLVYQLLLKIDHRIGEEVYKQAPLPGFPPA